MVSFWHRFVNRPLLVTALGFEPSPLLQSPAPMPITPRALNDGIRRREPVSSRTMLLAICLGDTLYADVRTGCITNEEPF